MKIEALEVHGDMLEARHGEKDFLLRHDEKYIHKVTQSVGEATKHLKILQQLHQDAGHSIGVKESDKALAALAHYQNAFDQMANLWIQRGLEKTSGLQGEFRKSARNLEATIKKRNRRYGLNVIMINYLMLRRYEKDYLLDLDKETYLPKIKGQILGIFRSLAATSMSPLSSPRL